MPRVKRPTRATVTTRLTPKTEPRAAQSMCMLFVPYTVAGRVGSASGAGTSGDGMVAVRSSVTGPAGGGVKAAMAVVTTPAGSSAASLSALTLVWSTTWRRETFQIAAQEATRKT